MCGRYASQLPADTIRALFATTGPVPNVAPSWNVAPTQPAMVVRRHPDTGERRLDLLQWGLVPSWTKDPRAARRPINARAETAAGSGMFKSALATRRCLIPADAFYEWQARADGKQPFAIARADGAPLAFAGLWEGWRGADGEILRSFTILTIGANAAMRVLHERMPVILEHGDWAVWLDPASAHATTLMQAAANDMLRFWPVSRAVNAVRNNGPQLLDPVDDQAMPGSAIR
ncbi:SOS response-associated peptidase [Acidisphaera sp. L21]|uniref:SOS response-associated peptidase n=1 Tax=Acidisphaera sp. L21 TaxID=1641851 RepID=UPI00131B0A2D|nr:SOS response-associated peptidase [Acidisphaera sp. L21]